MTGSDLLSPTADAVWRRFADVFGSPEPVLCFAPGRLNLIGAHLDYSGGDVLPLAVNLGVYAAARRRKDSKIRLCSINQELEVEIDAADLGATADPALDWARYPVGVWREFAIHHPPMLGVDVVFGGDLPIASGLSSSAAIEVVMATALAAVNHLEIPAQEIALLAHRAEIDFAGVKCGIMDQFASAHGREGHALLLHCHSREHEHVPMDPTRFAVLVVDTRKPRNLSSTEFNRRVDECRRAFEAMCEFVGPRDCLAAFTVSELEQALPRLEAVLAKRARHVVGEMQRVHEAVASLRSGDVARLGALVSASHESTRVDYEVSCDELDAITSSANEHEHAFGARLTGAGFGGCAFALVDPDHTLEVERKIRSDFVHRFGIEPGFAVLRAGAGPRRIR